MLAFDALATDLTALKLLEAVLGGSLRTSNRGDSSSLLCVREILACIVRSTR